MTVFAAVSSGLSLLLSSCFSHVDIVLITSTEGAIKWTIDFSFKLIDQNPN